MGPKGTLKDPQWTRFNLMHDTALHSKQSTVMGAIGRVERGGLSLLFLENRAVEAVSVATATPTRPPVKNNSDCAIAMWQALCNFSFTLHNDSMIRVQLKKLKKNPYPRICLLILEREEGERERERVKHGCEREASNGFLSYVPQLGSEPTT